MYWAFFSFLFSIHRLKVSVCFSLLDKFIIPKQPRVPSYCIYMTIGHMTDCLSWGKFSMAWSPCQNISTFGISETEIDLTLSLTRNIWKEAALHSFTVTWMLIYICNGEAEPPLYTGSGATQDVVNSTFELLHELKRLSVNQKLYYTWFTTLSIYHTSLWPNQLDHRSFNAFRH